MGAMTSTTALDLAIAEHKRHAARADRIGWMVDDRARSHKQTAQLRTRGLVIRMAGAVAAVLALLPVMLSR